MIQKPSLSDFIFIALFFSVLALGTQMLSLDSDLGRHLTLGNYILDHRVVPTRDLFSHTQAGQSRPPYEWMSQVVFALAYRLLGLDGVILMTATIIGITFLLLLQHSSHRSQFPLIALMVTLLSAAATSIHWLPRPHVITFLLLAIWINKLEGFRIGKKTEIYIFPLTMLLWANLHGGFVFGFLAWGAYFAGWVIDKRQNKTTKQTAKNLILAGIFSFAASIITPDLWHNWEAVLNNRSAFVLSRTIETMQPDFSNPVMLPFVILLVLTTFFSALNWRDLSASHIFLLGGLGFISLLMTRNIPLFAIACAPILSGWISKKLSLSTQWVNFEKRFMNLSTPNRWHLVPLITVFAAFGYFAYNQSHNKPMFQFNPQVFPVQAVDWIESNPIEGRMFNEFNWGGYLLFRLRPQHQVFLDSQSDFYGEPLMREYENILIAQDNWKDLFNKYQISWAIIPVHSPLAKALASDSEWATAYQDLVAIIYYRK